MTCAEIAGAGLPGIGYSKQQQNASITLPPPKLHPENKSIPTTDSKDYAVKVESSGLSVPVLGKDLVLTEKDLVNIANSISSTNRDISLNAAQEVKPPSDVQPSLSPFEPRRNFNHDVPWETNYPPRPIPPPPHGEWNQPPPIGPPREEFNRPPPKEWGDLPPPEEFRRFHGRPNEWIHPSRRPEGSWGFDHQRDRRWKGELPPGPPPEFRRDMFRGDRDPAAGIRDFPPVDERRMQEGFHQFDEHNRPIGAPPFRDPFRWERGNEPAWRGRDQFDPARGPRGPESSQSLRPPLADQQQQLQQQQQQQPQSLDNKNDQRQQMPHDGQPLPKNQETIQDVNRQQPDLVKGPSNKEAPLQGDHQNPLQPFDPPKGPGPLPNQPQPDPSRMNPQQLRTINSPLQGGPPPNFNQPFDPGRNLEGTMLPPMTNQQPFGHARDPRMAEGPVGQPPFVDGHKQIPPHFPDAPLPNQFNRGDALPQQGAPPGRHPEGPPLIHQHHPIRGSRGQEPAWLQDTNKRTNLNEGTFPPNQQQQFDPNNAFAPTATDGSPNINRMPQFDPNRSIPPFQPSPFRSQEQPAMANQMPHSEAASQLHAPETMDVPKRPEQFIQKGLKQKDSTAPPWRDPKAAEQIIGNAFNDKPVNQQQLHFRTLLSAPMQDSGNPVNELPPDQFPPGRNPLKEPGPFDKGPPPFSQAPSFNDRIPGQGMDPRMRNVRQEMSFDPRMDGPRIEHNFNPRMEPVQQQQMPPPGEMSGMGQPNSGRRHDFGRPVMGQKYDPRMRPPGKEEPAHPTQEFSSGRDRDLAQDPPWHNSGIEQRLGPPREFSDENFDSRNDPKRKTLLPPPIMVHKDEEPGNFHNSGRQDEFSEDNRRREPQRFDDYRGDKSWSNRSEYDRGRREPQREIRRSPPRRNSNDRPSAKRPRREKDMPKPSSRHSEGRDSREKDRGNDKDRKPERREKSKSSGSEKPSMTVANEKTKSLKP